MTTGFTRAPPKTTPPILQKYARETIGIAKTAETKGQTPGQQLSQLIYRREKERLNRKYGVS